MELIAQNVCKIIRGKPILSDVNLHLKGGSVYGFAGPNGSGKTMLFRALSGLISVTSGTISLDGKVLRRDFDVLPSLGIVLEHVGLYPNLTGLENLEYLASLRGRVQTEDLRGALLRVGLDPNDRRTYRKYSLGMKQRLAIAQAVMERPDVIMLDEDDWSFFLREIYLGWKDKLKEESFDSVLNLWSYVKQTVSGDMDEEEMKAQDAYDQRQESGEGDEQTPEGPEPTDPRDGLADLLGGGLLNAALPDGYTVSEKTADLSDVSYPVEKERLWDGLLDFKDAGKVKDLFDNLSGYMDLSSVIQKGAWFAALYSYIPEAFSNGGMGWEGAAHDRALDYEMEYLLNGSGSDRENLEAAVKKTVWLRMFLNMAYLLTHPSEDAKVRETAALIAGFLLIPEFQEVICLLLKLAWAYAESLADCRCLLRGEKVSLIKKEGEWKVSWESMLGLSAETLNGPSEGDTGSGLDYTGYLTLFLMLTPRETLMRRMTHLMEENIRLTEGNASFRMSNCVYGIRNSFSYNAGGLSRQDTAVSMTY